MESIKIIKRRGIRNDTIARYNMDHVIYISDQSNEKNIKLSEFNDLIYTSINIVLVIIYHSLTHHWIRVSPKDAENSKFVSYATRASGEVSIPTTIGFEFVTTYDLKLRKKITYFWKKYLSNFLLYMIFFYKWQPKLLFLIWNKSYVRNSHWFLFTLPATRKLRK